MTLSDAQMTSQYFIKKKTRVLLSHQRFSSLQLNWGRVENDTLVLTLNSRIDWYATWPPSSIHDLKRYDLTLTSGLTLNLTFTRQRMHHSTRLDERMTKTLKFCPYAYVSRSFEKKTTFGSLSWPLRLLVDLKPEVWIPIAASRNGWHARFFRDALAQLGAKRRRRVRTTTTTTTTTSTTQ